ncbi:MAG: hypothetical protein GC168_16115 [Candidatus Hydrogenedens sp.]|nr:hypothetical protein [Candidatus Hydrogenedens sp.]
MAANPVVKPCACSGASATGGRAARWSAETLRWLLPAGTLALMPKCPMCLAGYIALFTGLGVSVPLAGYLRWGAIVVCVAWLGLLLLWRARRLLGQQRSIAPR